MTTPLTTGARIAVVGGGPAGLIAARALAAAGLEPFVLEQGAALGGGWDGPGTPSGPGDLEVPEDWSPRAATGTPARYACAHGIARRVRFGARVRAVRPAIAGGDGWDVTIEDVAEGGIATRRFAAVVAATTRVPTPRRADAGAGFGPGVRVAHAATYGGPAPLLDRRVLVLGDAPRALEIAAELAGEPTIAVLSAARRPGLAARGDDGAARGPLRLTGPATCATQRYLALVAEGRVDARPALSAVAGGVATFADGSRARVDAVVLACGDEVALPYVDLDLDLLEGLTFAPGRAGLAAVGQFALDGPAVPVLEQQARWLEAVWTGRRRLADLPALGSLPFHRPEALAQAFAQGAQAQAPAPRRLAVRELAAAA